MIDDLKEIKRRYGENFSHLCRDNFSKILSEPGVLFNIINNTFAPTRSLYQDIIDNDLIIEFKNFIYSEYDKIKQTNLEEVKEIFESPYELLDKAGFELFECKNEEEIQSFKKWYKEDEIICTIYNGGRLTRCYVFFAVKKNAQEIKRENFTNPKREDEYGTSVLSIQFPKQGTCVPDIISRYNHTVRDPNGTYGCDLNKVAPGLEESFKKLLAERGLELNKSNQNEIDLPHYTVGPDGKYYRYNVEENGIYYCENNVVIDHGEITKYDLEKYLIIDNFIVDLVNKKIYFYDDWGCDSFINYFDNIENIKVVKNGDCKDIIVSQPECEDVIITIDKHNSIIGYKNSNLEKIDNDFLTHCKNIKNIDIKNVKSIGNDFLRYNQTLEQLDLPEVEEIGNGFLLWNKSLKTLNASKVKIIGSSALNHNQNMEELNLPEVEEIGNHFLQYNNILKTINAKKLRKIGFGVLQLNEAIEFLDLPELEIIGDGFLEVNKSLKTLNASKVKIIGNGVFSNNREMEELYLPEVEIIGDKFLQNNVILKKINVKKVKKIGYRFLFFNKNLEELDLSNVAEVDQHFMSSNKILKVLNMPTSFGGLKYINNPYIKNLLLQEEKKKLIDKKDSLVSSLTEKYITKVLKEEEYDKISNKKYR